MSSATIPIVSVRRAGSADADRLARLRRAWAEEEGLFGDPSFEDRFAGWLDLEGDRRRRWLGFKSGQAVGMLNMAVFTRMPKPNRPSQCWGYVANVFVLAEHRNLGIGRALIDAAIDYARRERFARLVVNPSERSIPLYRRAGFGPSRLYQLDLDD